MQHEDVSLLSSHTGLESDNSTNCRLSFCEVSSRGKECAMRWATHESKIIHHFVLDLCMLFLPLKVTGVVKADTVDEDQILVNIE